LAARGYTSEDRNNQEIFHPLVSMSIGASYITPDQYFSHHEVSAAATSAKENGPNALQATAFFIEQRNVPLNYNRLKNKLTTHRHL